MVWTCTGWTGTGSVAATGSGSTTTFTITADSSITWTWSSAPVQFIITVSFGANGMITPGTQPVNYGSDLSFTITPDIGYHILDVVVDGVSKGTISSYAFTDIEANHEISASFWIDVYTPFSIISNSTISQLAFNSANKSWASQLLDPQEPTVSRMSLFLKH